MPYASLLEDRSVIAVKGTEARSFLQGLISNDMEDCAPGTGIYAALLTPQGKILFEFFVAEHEDRFLLDCAAARAPDLVKRLTFYRLRAKVDIALAADLKVAALWDGTVAGRSADGVAVFADPRLPALGARLIGPLPATAKRDCRMQSRRLSRPPASISAFPTAPTCRPTPCSRSMPGSRNWAAVDFRKGCYVGQEVTSRMKHRASARRRFLIAEVDGDLPPPGTKLEASGREVGTLATGHRRTGARAGAARSGRGSDAVRAKTSPRWDKK